MMADIDLKHRYNTRSNKHIKSSKSMELSPKNINKKKEISFVQNKKKDVTSPNKKKNCILQTASKRNRNINNINLEINKNTDVSSNTYKKKIDTSELESKLESSIIIKSLAQAANKRLKKKQNINYGIPDDIEYSEEEEIHFKKLNVIERLNIIRKEKQILKINECEIPIRFKILNLKSISMRSKAYIIDRIDHFYTLDSTDNEYHKLYIWTDYINKIEFDKFIKIPISIKDSKENIYNYLYKCRKIMDHAIYDHNDAKDKIITTITKLITNPNGTGVSIGIQGPPGNGKTTLIKEGICKALNRPFALIGLGGAHDSSFMTGHDYTYEGAKPGKLVEILINTKCMNPVIYFDELDKISKTEKGDEISNFLCHLIDSSQNNEIEDKYLSGIKLDLSKAIFIFSYNDASLVNPVLMDRLYKINTDGFNTNKKTIIAQEYLIPKILDDFNIQKESIIFNKSSLEKIIENYCDNEKGVRNLKRSIETIVSTLNVLQYTTNEKSINKQNNTSSKPKKNYDHLNKFIQLHIKNIRSSEQSKFSEDKEKNTNNSLNNNNIDINSIEIDLSDLDSKNIIKKNINNLQIKFPFTVTVENLEAFITNDNKKPYMSFYI